MLYLFLFLIIVFVLMASLYNRLVSLCNRRENAFADIDVQLRQRHDLVPQLVETVKGYAAHEKELLMRVTEARTAAMKAGTIDEKIAAENLLAGSLQGLKIAVENYPDLKANQNFLRLQEELGDVENKLAAARRFFNAATTEYNTAAETFPSNMIAGSFGFKRETLFGLGENRQQMEEPPKVSF